MSGLESWGEHRAGFRITTAVQEVQTYSIYPKLSTETKVRLLFKPFFLSSIHIEPSTADKVQRMRQEIIVRYGHCIKNGNASLM